MQLPFKGIPFDARNAKVIYLCTYVCVFVCTYVPMCAYMYVRMYMCVHGWMQAIKYVNNAGDQHSKIYLCCLAIPDNFHSFYYHYVNPTILRQEI